MFTLHGGCPLPQDLAGEIRAAGATQSASELKIVASGAPMRAATDRVLMRLLGFIGSYATNLVSIPPRRVGRGFLGHDPEHVWQIVQGVDHFFHISVLEPGNGIGRGHRDGAGPFFPTSITIVSAVDIVGSRERIAVAGASENVEPLTREQIDAGVNAGIIQGLRSGA